MNERNESHSGCGVFQKQVETETDIAHLGLCFAFGTGSASEGHCGEFQ